jgi:hypothetical protein
VRLDERLEAEVAGELDEPGQSPGGMERREEQDEIGAGGPQERQLTLVHDELLGQDGDAHGRTHGAQVGYRAAEPVGLAEDGDRGGPAAGTARSHDVVRRRDRPADGESLHLGDWWRPGGERTARPGAVPRLLRASAVARASSSAQVGGTSGGDLRPTAPRRICRGATVTREPSVRAPRPRPAGPRRSERLLPRPESIVRDGGRSRPVGPPATAAPPRH